MLLDAAGWRKVECRQQLSLHDNPRGLDSKRQSLLLLKAFQLPHSGASQPCPRIPLPEPSAGGKQPEFGAAVDETES